MSFDFQKNSSLTSRESSHNALRRIQDKERDAQACSVYEHTRGDDSRLRGNDVRSDTVLCRSSSIFTDSPCIGLDFDNTIVCYDQVFHQVALEQHLIPKELPASKEIIRDYLRQANAEDEWTLLQGTVYGTRMQEASPFPGLFDFLKTAKEAGFKITIISHKTKTPYLGPPHDLHEAALSWMKSQLFFDAKGADIAEENVFLETSKEKKLARIKTAGCHLFIDDLPELLSDPSFPAEVQPLLFSSSTSRTIPADWLVAGTWERVLTLVTNYFSHGN
jgi:hypothetical protein